MKLQKTSLVYFSATQTTQKVSRAIAEGIGLPITEVDFTLPKDRLKDAPTFGPEDLVVVGAPVYVGRIPSFLMEYMGGLKGEKTPCVLLGVYGNREYDDYLVELEDLLKKAGFLPIAAGAFIGEHSFSHTIAGDRPNAADLKEAKAFGEKIVQKLEKLENATPLDVGVIPGTRPYRELMKGRMSMAPIVKDTCINCGTCASRCPTAAINPENVREIDPDRCCRCRSCARVCPVGAIDFFQPKFEELVKHHEQLFGKPDKVNFTLL